MNTMPQAEICQELARNCQWCQPSCDPETPCTQVLTVIGDALVLFGQPPAGSAWVRVVEKTWNLGGDA